MEKNNIYFEYSKKCGIQIACSLNESKCLAMFTHFTGDDIKVYTNFFDTEVTSTVQLVAVENGAPILDEDTSTSRCLRYSLLSSSIFLLHVESFEVEEEIMVGSSAI